MTILRTLLLSMFFFSALIVQSCGSKGDLMLPNDATVEELATDQ